MTDHLCLRWFFLSSAHLKATIYSSTDLFLIFHHVYHQTSGIKKSHFRLFIVTCRFFPCVFCFFFTFLWRKIKYYSRWWFFKSTFWSPYIYSIWICKWPRRSYWENACIFVTRLWSLGGEKWIKKVKYSEYSSLMNVTC